MEGRIGSLQPGKLADVTIVDGDLQATAPERIGSAWDVDNHPRRQHRLVGAHRASQGNTDEFQVMCSATSAFSC